jgi:hypothetical protein
MARPPPAKTVRCIAARIFSRALDELARRFLLLRPAMLPGRTLRRAAPPPGERRA